MTSDLDLLEKFTRKNSQDAFGEIVRRHLNLVYSAALRQVRSPQLAEEIAQSVFADLARQAGKLKADTVMTAWLYAVTRRTSIDAVRKESRRHLREEIAVEMSNMNATANEWVEIGPLLDEAMAALDEADRTAVLLRYFENKSLREVGDGLKISEDAAQKRVSRAVERLREFFSKRKIAVGASGLAVLISANAVQSAPVGLALAITTASLKAGTTLTFMKVATAAKLKLVLGALVVAGAITTLVIQQHHQTELRGENESLQQQIAQLQTDNENLSNRLVEIGDTQKLTDEQYSELLRLRSEIGVLRRQLDELAEKKRALQKANVTPAGSNTNPPAPQIFIKTRFLTVPKDVLAGSGDLAGVNGILTGDNASNILRQVESRSGVETLAEPQVVSTSGRQFEMRATQVISVVTRYYLLETNGVSMIAPQTEPVETGPVLDVMPRILSDGHTIELSVMGSVTEFLGYAPTTNTTPALTTDGQEVDVPEVSPEFRVQRATNSVNLPDGQALVFTLNDDQASTDTAPVELNGSKPKSFDRQTLVLVTATIVDQAGNRLYPP